MRQCARREERNGEKNKQTKQNILRKRKRERHNSEVGDKRGEQRPDCQDDIQDDPLFPSMGDPGQTPEQSAYSHTQTFLAMPGENARKRRMENEC